MEVDSTNNTQTTEAAHSMSFDIRPTTSDLTTDTPTTQHTLIATTAVPYTPDYDQLQHAGTPTPTDQNHYQPIRSNSSAAPNHNTPF